MSVAVIVLAKEPLPGRCKTRLSPPCTTREAATLAAAAITDTLTAVASSNASRKIVAADGRTSGWVPRGFEIMKQRGDSLGARLGNTFVDFDEPALVIGMDTPQITAEILDQSCARLEDSAVDVVLGATLDGGYWGIGFKQPVPRAFACVPMSAPNTFDRQVERLGALGLSHAVLPKLRDVDTFDDACAVAAAIPASEFAYTLGRVLGRIRERIA